MSSKLDIINGAYSKMRINGLTVNPTPELVAVALDVLEDMMADYDGRAINIGYNFEDVPDVNSPTGVEHTFNLMMKSNLAVNLIPDFGKEVPAKLHVMASVTLSNAVGASAMASISEVPYPNRMPLGSGNTLRNNQRHKFYRAFKENPVSSAVLRLVVGDIEDYKESFHSYLSGEVIASVVITSSTGLSVVSQSDDGEIVSYRVKAESVATSGPHQTIKMIMTSDTGRVDTRVIEFEIATTRI